MKGYYYFCDPGTPHYPDWHFFGSRVWHEGDGTPDPPLGEQPGKQKWRNGSFPVTKPLPRLIGTQDCIDQGNDEPPAAAPYFIFGVDSRCWDKPPIGGGLAIGAGGAAIERRPAGGLRLSHRLTYPLLPAGGLGLGGSGRGQVVLGGLGLTGLDRGQRRGGIELAGTPALHKQSGLLLGGHGDSNKTPTALQQTTALFGTGTGSASASGTWPAATAAGDFLIIGVVAKGSTATPTISAPSAWSQVNTATNGTLRVSTFIAPNAASQTTTGFFAASVSSGTVEIDGAAGDWQGINHTSPTDVSVNNTGSGSSPATASTGTLAQARELVSAIIGWDGGSTIVGLTNSFNLDRIQRGTACTVALIEKLVTVNTSTNTSGVNGGTIWIANISSYRRP